MPKSTQGPRRTTTQGAASGSRGKGRRKQRASDRPTAKLTSKQREVPSKVVTPTQTPTVSLPTPGTRQIAPQPHVFSDLKRIGIIAGAMLLILIILYLVL